MKIKKSKNVRIKLLSLMMIAILPFILSGCEFSPPIDEKDIIVPIEIMLSGTDKGNVGDTIQLTLTVLPENASRDFSWISSDLSIASVTQQGLVTLHKVGTVSIIALFKHSELQTSLVITVEETDEEPTFSVTFIDGEDIIEVQEINLGEEATAPTPPEKPGFIFVGWDVDFSEVTKDLIVKAIYEALKETYTVTFMDGEDIIEIQEVNSGEAATAPTPLEKAGFVFIGWDVDFSEVTQDLIVTAIYEDEALFPYMTIKDVKKAIDNRSNEQLIFVGTVIGFDSMGFAHIADSTGAIYVRATSPLLTLGAIVKINGYGIVWEGTETYPEYTRQITNNQIIIEEYNDVVSPPKAIQKVTLEELITTIDEYTTAEFHNNLVEVTGIVKTGNDRFSFYLTDDDGNHIAGIHHYSTNFKNQITDPTQNVFLNLNGRTVTLIGVIYRFYITENIWTIQCIGIENEVIVHDHDEERFTVTFMDGEDIIDVQEVVLGTSAIAPTPPQKDGFNFIGWDIDFSQITQDITVNAIYEEQQTLYTTIEDVKQAIDNRSTEQLVFVGTVIGFDSMGFAHVADSTGAIYVRATSPLLTLGAVVKIIGYGTIWEGTDTYPEYTRQITNNQITIEKYDGYVSPPRPVMPLSYEDLELSKDDYINAPFHNNLVEITGVVKTGSDRFSFYLTDNDGHHIAAIHHYSTNFRNQITDPTQNVFLTLNGKTVTLVGIMYRFYLAEDIWTIQCIGIDNEVVVQNGDEEDLDEVRLFMINDTHGALYTDEGVPGLEKVSSLLKSLEAQHGSYIKIANGDILQGAYVSNINFGRPIIDVLNAMQFDAFVIGNHEFDWGIDKIAAYADGNIENGEADFPFLAANIVVTATQEKLPWTQDYVIIEQGENRIGVIGMIGYGLESSIEATRVAGYSFLNPVPIAASLSQELREIHGCNVVIVAIHDHNQNTNQQFAQLTGNSRIDGILCAHTHQQLAYFEARPDGYQIPVMQSYHKNYSASTMVIPIEDGYPSMRLAALTHHDPRTYPSDDAILNVLLPYSEDIAEANTVVGYTVERLNRYRLGTEMVTAIQEHFDSDIAIMNTGGVRAEIGVGNIMVKHIYEVFPFDNTVIITTIPGADMIRLFNDHSGYLYFDQQFNVGSLNPNESYTLAVIDYVFNNSYYTSYFENCIEIVYTNALMRDIFIHYVEEFYLS